MKLYGLIGYPLEHSFSPEYFRKKFAEENINADYRLFPLKKIEDFVLLIKQFPDLKGLNVTIPYKKSIVPYLTYIDVTVKNTGACNTIKIDRVDKEVKLSGYNTDVSGFEMLINKYLDKTNKKALVLGNGGAAAAVIYVLQSMNISFRIVSRKPQNAEILSYQDITPDTIRMHEIIINTTPLGMYPDISSFPAIPYEFITEQHFCIDLIYNPTETVFMKKCRARGATVVNGLEMLYAQADKSWWIWNNAQEDNQKKECDV